MPDEDDLILIRTFFAKHADATDVKVVRQTIGDRRGKFTELPTEVWVTFGDRPNVRHAGTFEQLMKIADQ